MGIHSCDCILELLAVEKVECVLQSLLSLLLELLFLSVVEGKDVSVSEVLISWGSGGCVDISAVVGW